MILEHFRLDSKSARVTGAVTGIGAAIAVTLGKAGADAELRLLRSAQRGRAR